VYEGSRLAGERDDDHALEFRLPSKLFIELEQDVVDYEEPAAGVVGDVCKIARSEAQVKGVHDGAGGGDAKIGFEVCVVIPHERGDAVSPAYAGFLESFGESSGAAVDLAIGRAVQGAVRKTGDDFRFREQFAGALENVNEREWIVHHGAEHGVTSSWHCR